LGESKRASLVAWKGKRSIQLILTYSKVEKYDEDQDRFQIVFYGDGSW